MGDTKLKQIFPKWMNLVPAIVLVGIVVHGIGAVGFVWYYFSPKYTDVGYRPKQPVPFSHKLHAGDLGMDCRYCHSGVEVSSHSNVPATQVCMNCHQFVKTDSEKLELVRASYEKDEPIEWVRVHKLPDYAFFNHAAHVRVGVGCESCHGNVAAMEIVMQTEPLSMGWCLDCHRNPDEHIRPLNKVTEMNWQPDDDHKSWVEQAKSELGMEPPVDCSGCHR